MIFAIIIIVVVCLFLSTQYGKEIKISIAGFLNSFI